MEELIDENGTLGFYTLSKIIEELLCDTGVDVSIGEILKRFVVVKFVFVLFVGYEYHIVFDYIERVGMFKKKFAEFLHPLSRYVSDLRRSLAAMSEETLDRHLDPGSVLEHLDSEVALRLLDIVGIGGCSDGGPGAKRVQVDVIAVDAKQRWILTEELLQPRLRPAGDLAHLLGEPLGAELT